jgi:CubicO group peptidase (beta-lactamase class C family)
MRTILILITLGGLCPTATAQWTLQESGTKARLRGLGAVSGKVAWASGAGGTVLRTLDGGRTWEPRVVPDAGDLDFRDVEAIDDRTAYLLSIGEGDRSRIAATNDGGATWEFLYRNHDPKGFLDAIAFWDADHGLALGDPVGGRFVILRTEDGGKTWAGVPHEGMPEALPGEGAFAASGTCLVVGEAGNAWFATGGATVARVFRSTDRGRTWTAHETPVVAGNPSSGIFSLAFRDADHGIAVGGDYREPARTGKLAALTADGGRTWRVAEGRGLGGYRSAVAYVPGTGGQTLVAVGPTGSDVTSDGGERWERLGTTGFNSVHFRGEAAGWAVGEDGTIATFAVADSGGRWAWATASPESQGMDGAALESAWAALKDRRTTALLVVRHDRIVFERYAPDFDRQRPHYTASMAKALVGGLGLMLAMGDGRIRPDDPAWRFAPQWRDDPGRKAITVRHLATHTSGIEDAEEGSVPHDRLAGWKGDFWKRLPPPRDPFTLARDHAPVLEEPGTRERYSNPGMAMLGYCVTASLRGAPEEDLRSLLHRRVMGPLGVPDAEWSVGYGTSTTVDGLPLVATWGGGSCSPDAAARVGRLLLREGDWEGRRLIDTDAVAAGLEPSGLPGHSGLGWWVNRGPGGTKLWESAPEDAFGGAGAGQQFLLVVPSLDLIVVRNGEQLDADLGFEVGLDRYVVGPVVRAITAGRAAPCPPSPVVKEVR